MRRKILAVLAFNIYALFFVSAFQESTAYLFESNLIESMRLSGLDPRDWGWGDHYIWRLFAAVVVTACVGFLAGAIARQGGAVISALANIPSVLIWLATIYLLKHPDDFEAIDFDSRYSTEFIVVSIIAIPLTTLIAYFSGRIGEEEAEYEPHDSVLGIKGYHWIWAVYPLYLYSLGLISVCAGFIKLIPSFLQYALSVREEGSMAEMSIVIILLFAMLIPIVLWVYPLQIVYRMLASCESALFTQNMHMHMQDKYQRIKQPCNQPRYYRILLQLDNILTNCNAIVKGVLILGILGTGFLLATVVQVLIYAILLTFLSNS